MHLNAHINDQKKELIQWLSALEDNSIIERLVEFKKSESIDFWESTSAAEKESIEKGFEDSKNKRLISHSSAKKLYEKWL